MSGPAKPTIIAEVGAVVVAEDGPLVVVVDRGTGPLAVLAFVLGVVALVCGGFGAIALVSAVTSDGDPGVPASVGCGLFAIGAVAAAATFAVIRTIRGSRAKPLSGYRPVAVFDRARGVCVDGNGVVVSPLAHVRFQRSMQLTSSSPKLVAMTPHGSWVLARGNPFFGGIGSLDAVLTDAVHATPR